MVLVKRGLLMDPSFIPRVQHLNIHSAFFHLCIISNRHPLWVIPCQINTKNPYPHRFERKLVLSQCQETLEKDKQEII